jgi:hypothetical protein
LIVRDQPHYRRQAFEEGLKRAGYRVRFDIGDVAPQRSDVLVCWNRYGGFDDAATRWERRGGTVIVAENGYIGHDANGIQHYALALHGHNGSGQWFEGDARRWERLNIDPKPWRSGGSHIVVRGQRGIGSPTMASPAGWHHATAQHLRSLTPRSLMVQEHPGKPACDAAQTAALINSLRDAYAVCIWSSAAGVRALVEGVPVFYDAPHWVCAGAAVRGHENIDAPTCDDAARLHALQRMAWAQWSVAEIASGEPFIRLIGA